MSLTDELPLGFLDLPAYDVRKRFEWSARPGNPLWLWPDVTTAQWSHAMSAITKATRSVLNEERAVPLEGNADHICLAAFTSGMGPLLGHWKECGLLQSTPDVGRILSLHYRHNRRRMECLTAHAIAAVEGLGAAGIRATILKGMHLAYDYFPDPGTRPASDIDLLVDQHQKISGERVLKRLGYAADVISFGQQAWRVKGTPHELPSLLVIHQDGPWTLDLHTSLNTRRSPGAPLLEIDQALGSEPRANWRCSRFAGVLAPHELVLHLSVHASLNFVSLNLIRLTDLVYAIRKNNDDRTFTWDSFLRLAEKAGALGTCFPALHYANALVPGLVPTKVLKVLEATAPRLVRGVVARLTPATCHQVNRYSLAERFMWTIGFTGWMHELASCMLPSLAWRDLVRVNARRLGLVVRGQVSY